VCGGTEGERERERNRPSKNVGNTYRQISATGRLLGAQQQ